MPKFYVKSGTIKEVFNAFDEKEAAVNACKRHFDDFTKNKRAYLEDSIYISEIGFSQQEDTLTLPTSFVLDMAGMMQLFT